MVEGVVRILVLQESDWVERGPHQSHHLFERLRQKGHRVRIVDFEIGWRDRHDRSVLVPRKEFIASPKVIEHADVEVVRPAVLRFAYLDYASLLVTHWLEIRRGSGRPDEPTSLLSITLSMSSTDSCLSPHSPVSLG